MSIFRLTSECIRENDYSNDPEVVSVQESANNIMVDRRRKFITEFLFSPLCEKYAQNEAIDLLSSKFFKLFQQSWFQYSWQFWCYRGSFKILLFLLLSDAKILLRLRTPRCFIDGNRHSYRSTKFIIAVVTVSRIQLTHYTIFLVGTWYLTVGTWYWNASSACSCLLVMRHILSDVAFCLL